MNKDRHLITFDGIAPSASLFIYGAGGSSGLLKKALDEVRPDIIVKAFLDTFKRGQKEGLPVITPEDLTASGDESPILIASDFWKEIVPLLDNLHRDYAIVDCHALDSLLRYHRSDSPAHCCHYHELFVNARGEVFPCCMSWWNEKMKIGHINDKDLFNAIEQFDGCCSCGRSKFKKAQPGQRRDYYQLNLELSLACQSHCAMCCVDAPLRGDEGYEYYDAAERLIEWCRPKELLVQGGEVLVQKKSLLWLAQVKKKYPQVALTLITNGNVPLSMVKTVEELFSEVKISLYAFQPHTYRIITGLDAEKTKAFAKELLHRRKLTVSLKYLVTPLCCHETSLFVDWAVRLLPERVILKLSHSNLHQYVNTETIDSFWSKIFERSARDLRETIAALTPFLLEQDTVLWVPREEGATLGMDGDFIKAQGLEHKILWSELEQRRLYALGKCRFY